VWCGPDRPLEESGCIWLQQTKLWKSTIPTTTLGLLCQVAPFAVELQGLGVQLLYTATA